MSDERETGENDGDAGATELLEVSERGPDRVRRFQLVVLEGPQAGQSWDSVADRCSVGSHSSNDLVLDDPTVSRFHCEVRVDASGARLKDLDSRNGTVVDGLRIKEAWLRGGSLLRLGRTVIRFQLGTETNRLPISERTQFGSMVGKSVAMRAVFAQLERASSADATVLIEGETGTGKEGAAQSIHDASARAQGPFIVVDCGAVPPNLLESELFGHERGAFTGAATRRVGAFEEASGGTIFLDEIGELSADLQPKLLRVLEQRHVRRIGTNTYQPVDVRVIAATNRDLRSEVNRGRFRADLYFRLAVLKITLPPLRARPDDIPLLAERLLESIGAGVVGPGGEDSAARLREPEFLAHLSNNAWPGNVRELRNYLERCLVFEEGPHCGQDDQVEHAPFAVDANVPFIEARRRAIAEFERLYVKELLRLHDGPAAQAARAAGIDRNYLYRLMRRHGFKE